MAENEATPRPEQGQQNTLKPHKFAWFKTIFISIFISIFVSGTTFYLYDTYFAPKIITVDLKEFVNTQKKLFLAGLIDEKTMQKNTELFKKKIKSAPKNTIILVKEAVVSDEESLEN